MIFYTTRRQFHINREKGGGVGREKVTLREGLCVPVSTQQRATCRWVSYVEVLTAVISVA